MRVGTATVVAVGGSAELKLQHLTRLFKKLDGVVDGGEAGGRVPAADLGVQFVHAGMTVSGCKRFERLRPAPGDRHSQLRKGVSHLVHAMLNLWVQIRLLVAVEGAL